MNREGKGKAVPVPITVKTQTVNEAVPWNNEEVETNNHGWVSGAVIFFVSLVIILFLGAPAWTLFSLNRGLKNEDSEAVQRFIDTEGVKNQILNEAVGLSGNEEPSEIKTVADFVGEHITPAGLVAILKTSPDERPLIPVLRRTFGNFPTSKVRAFSYKNLDTVVVEMSDGMVLFLERAGIFDWRIFRVEFPSA